MHNTEKIDLFSYRGFHISIGAGLANEFIFSQKPNEKLFKDIIEL